MLWSDFFSRPEDLTASEVKTFLVDHTPGEFQLLDVRQPKEYQEHHLPGAQLIPLNELEGRLAELDPEVETIVYCRSGVRSRSACQFLRKRGFDKIYNMKGGILAWQGQWVAGSEESGLGYFLGGEYRSVYELSCNLEAGLQGFYHILAEKAEEEGKSEVAAVLIRMEQFEEGHIARLTAAHDKEFPDMALKLDDSLVEGGLTRANLIAAFGGNVETPEAVLQLAMSFEAQAFDLYSRLARKADNQPQQQFFTRMALEERKHLNILAEDLDLLLSRA